ncbi:MAG: RNA pseudouridine synthase [Elusimicrobia bacterium]|nr:RNA pseudouridine synthase [Elusimicrobiota bacterium]
MSVVLKTRKIPSRHQPRGFRILHDDAAIIVGEKAPGLLTVRAPYEREETVHHALNLYVRKGNSKSRQCVFVVHRLDRETSGLLVFAKTPEAQFFLKDNWDKTEKIYHAVVHGRMSRKEGLIESHLLEDEDYRVRSVDQEDGGKLARTQYRVLEETHRFSLVEVHLLTGRKNQIRVHFAESGHPIVGDSLYGLKATHYPRLALHASRLSFLHPVTGERLAFESRLPHFFTTLLAPVSGPRS